MADQQTDANNVPIDDNQDVAGADPGSNNAAPDPLLDEQPSGALSSVPKAGTKEDAQARLERSRNNMSALSKIYAADSGQLSDAYAQQKKSIQDATQRLLQMNFGASPQEEAYRMASVQGEASTGRYDPGAHNATMADILAQRRAAELQKQQLLASYGMQGAQAQIGQSTANLNRDIQLERIGQSDLTNASNLAGKYTNAIPKISSTGVKQTVNPDGSVTTQIDPVAQQAAQDAAAAKLKNSIALKQATMKLQQGQLDEPTVAFWADYAKQHGGQLPTGVARAGIAVPIMQRVAQDAATNGDTAMSIIAQGQITKASGDVLKDYQTGQTHKELNGLNTAVAHMNVFSPLIDTLNNDPNSFVNQVKNTWDSKVMGAPAPTSFNAVKEFVAGEVAKAVLPNGGGEREREAIAAAVSSSNSPAALKDAVAKWQELLAGKTQFTKMNWDQATQGKYGAFEDKFLLPQTRAALGIQSAPAVPPPRPGQKPPPPPTNAQGWPLHKDAAGNMAYVSPNGQVQEIH